MILNLKPQKEFSVVPHFMLDQKSQTPLPVKESLLGSAGAAGQLLVHVGATTLVRKQT